MPAHLKSPDQRVRRNATPGACQLPAEGYQGPIPDWPFREASEAELERWVRLWGLPQAAAWARMHAELSVARYVRNAILVEMPVSKAVNVATAHLHSEVRQLEDRLGLSPLAMMRLKWEIAPDELAEKREEARPARRIRAVDEAVNG